MANNNLMQFSDFCDYTSENIGDYLPEFNVVEAKVMNTKKNNGKVLKSLCIRNDAENISPNIYLDYYYKLYAEKQNIEDIMQSIAEEYKKARLQMGSESLEKVGHPDIEDIIPRLVNFEKNKDALKENVYLRYHDLAITFRHVISWTEEGMSSTAVTWNMLKQLDMSQNELYEKAVENYKVKFPTMVKSLGSMLSALLGTDDMETGASKEILVISNEQNINGATSILDKEALELAAQILGEEYYILPSSVHEVLCVPVSMGSNVKDLISMVREINQCVVSELDYLSDTVYRYSIDTGEISPIICFE